MVFLLISSFCSKPSGILMLLKNSAFFLLFLCLFSCATIIQGPNQEVGVSSTPSQASVWVDGNPAGETPLLINLSRSNSHLVRIELPGYEPYEAKFQSKFNAVTCGNIVCGGFIGIAVDACTGAVYRLDPEQLHAHLKKKKSNFSVKETEGCINCVIFHEAKGDNNWVKMGTLLPIK